MIETSGIQVLLVEDSQQSMLSTTSDVQGALPGATITWAADANTALGFIDETYFDLAICDLKIPAQRGDLSTQESHGLRVIARIQEKQPGTPLIILSGYGTVEKLDQYTATADVLPVLGAARVPMCQAAVKGAIRGLIPRLEPLRAGIDAMAGVKFSGVADIDPMLERAIAQYAVAHGYSAVEVTKASGLSGSVNSVVSMRSTGKPTKRVFVKVNRRDWIVDEVSRQRNSVEGYLDPAHWAPTLETVRAGLRDKGAYFSSLATDPVDLFTLSEKNEAGAVAVVARMSAVSHPWSMPNFEVYSLGDLRRLHLPDDQVIQLGISLSEFKEIEEIEISMAISVTHGDLHGENLLIVDGERPVLVDFAYTDISPAVLDPVTLEMSFLFHPASPIAQEGSQINYENWADGNYLLDTHYQAVTQKCREWATEGRDSREFLAMSYAHAIRHLKRADTVNPEHALRVARSAARGLS